MNNIAILLVFAALGLAWWSTLGARNGARNAARRACQRAGVSFIDELAFKKLRLGRDRRGMLCVKRDYAFEFYVRGNIRYAGKVEMWARRVASLEMEPYPDFSPQMSERSVDQGADQVSDQRPDQR